MKSKIRITIFAAIVVPYTINLSFSQFMITPGTGGAFGRTTAPIAGVGIGFFPFGTPTDAALHVNTNLTVATGSFGPGEVFRTTSSATAGNFNAWRMYTGAGMGTEVFNINNPGGTNDINITGIKKGNMNFRTNYALAPVGFGNRMIIVDGGFTNIGGRIAVGNSLVDGFVPASRLHLHQTDGTTDIRFTNDILGSTV